MNELWNFTVDTNAHCIHFIVDRSINVSLLTGNLAPMLTAWHSVNMTFCGPARDTVLTNRQTEKLKFHTNYTTNRLIVHKLRERMYIRGRECDDELKVSNDLYTDSVSADKVWDKIAEPLVSGKCCCHPCFGMLLCLMADHFRLSNARTFYLSEGTSSSQLV